MDIEQRFAELENRLFKELHDYHISLRSEILREVSERLETFRDRLLAEASKRNQASAFVQRPGHDGNATDTELREYYANNDNEPSPESTRMFDSGFPAVSSPWEKEAGVVQHFNSLTEESPAPERESNPPVLPVDALGEILERVMSKVLDTYVVAQEEPSIPAEVTEVIPPSDQPLYEYSWGGYSTDAYRRSVRDLGNFK